MEDEQRKEYTLQEETKYKIINDLFCHTLPHKKIIIIPCFLLLVTKYTLSFVVQHHSYNHIMCNNRRGSNKWRKKRSR